MFLSLCVTAFGATPLWLVKTNANGEIYLENTQTHEMMVEAFEMDDFGDKISIDLIEHADRLNHPLTHSMPDALDIIDSGDSVTIDRAAPYSMYDYTQTTQYTAEGIPEKVTPEVVGPASITSGESITVSESFVSVD